MAGRRAIGIVRVSQVKGREGESFASPSQQRERIEQACKNDDLELVEVLEELDVSGGTPLDQRLGLRAAIEAVEAGRAEVIVAAYFDRLMRSLRVQDELVSRVERAGGQVLAVDVGPVTNGSAGQWLSGTLLGAVSEYQRRTAAERSGEAQRRAVERGVLPYANIPPGYRRGDDGTLEAHSREAPIVAEALRMRANGATVKSVRAFLKEHGIERSYHGVGHLLASRVLLGEIHFGDLVNPTAHSPIVDIDTWNAAQRMVVSRGRKPKSDRLLARLGVLRCGSCGARMVIGTAQGTYYSYRCPPTGDCVRRTAIGADIAEEVIVQQVRTALADVEGRASGETRVQEADLALEEAQRALDGFVRMLSGLESESSTRERLVELRQARDDAQSRRDQLGGSNVAVTLNAADDWDRLTRDEQRALIRATVERATVAAGGRGANRISVKLFGE
jgi:DNA invertase Pin-like site-specific DNA recombinase